MNSKIDFNLNPFVVIWESTRACDLSCVHCRAAAQPRRLLGLNPQTLWFSSTASSGAPASAPRRKVEKTDVTRSITNIGEQVRYTRLRDEIMHLTECSKRTAQLAITEACREGWISQADGQYRLPL